LRKIAAKAKLEAEALAAEENDRSASLEKDLRKIKRDQQEKEKLSDSLHAEAENK
jgi:hypothetical protein